MNVVVTLEHRFHRTPDGRIWTNGPHAYPFWTRYLAEFDRVKVTARIADIPTARPAYRAASGPGVEFIAVPNYLGPWQYWLRSRAVGRAVRRSCTAGDAVVMRVSSHLAGCLEPWLKRNHYPFGLEVVNDPHDVFAPQAVRYRLRPLFRWWFTRQLRRQCRQASAVAYVTETALQKRYPSGGFSVGMSDVEISPDTIRDTPTVFTTHYSSVELSREDSVATHRRIGKQFCRNRLVSVGSMTQMYKAPDVLIRAVAECVAGGLDLSLELIGEGRYRAEMQRLAETLGVGGRVHFLGQLPAGAAVRERLDHADLFVLASRCEGLPRAMIEAMARSLPCIGSAVGGIPELLAAEDLVAPGDVVALSRRIREVLTAPDRMTRMSARNLQKAQEYCEDALEPRRRAFYRHLQVCTQAWLDSRAGVRHFAAGTVEG